jgi:gliding motility-associated-like protein
MKRTSITLALSACTMGAHISAQLAVTTNLSPTQLVQDVLSGTCVSITNVTYNGLAVDVPTGGGNGYFSGGSTIGLASGVILASGDVTIAAQPESSGASTHTSTGSDPDLLLLSGQASIEDKSILEFDFVPTGDSISFRYVFASEEYESFECSQWNDAFGFFLSGPGISGPFSNGAINIAVVPGTSIPITINTINSGLDDDFGSYCANADPNWQSNSIYYVNNENGPDLNYYGYTVVLTAHAGVQCNESYHIKLAIGDGSDDNYDSAVFLEAGSFSSIPFVPVLLPNAAVVGNTMYESCLPFSIDLVRTSCDDATTETVYLSYGGTATMGVDITPAFPTELVFGPSVNTITIGPFQVVEDEDDAETLVITTQTVDCNGDPATAEFEYIITEVAPLAVASVPSVIPCGQSVTIAPAVTGGYGQYTYAWSGGESGTSITLQPLQPVTVQLAVTDLCGMEASAPQTVNFSAAPSIGMSVFGNDHLKEGCGEAILNILRPQGVQGALVVDLSATGATNGMDFSMPQQASIPAGVINTQQPVPVLEDDVTEGDEVVTVTASYTNACAQTVTATDQFTIIDVDPLEASANNIEADCSGDTMLVSTVATGGVAPYQYLWHSEAQVTAGIWVGLEQDGQYAVTVTDDCGRQAEATSIVSITCELTIPNVFSPNHDNKNDSWVIDGLGSKPNTVRIFNRWGGLVLDVKNYRNTFAATNVPDGTYFYEIIVEGKPKPYTGHLTILRN